MNTEWKLGTLHTNLTQTEKNMEQLCSETQECLELSSDILVDNKHKKNTNDDKDTIIIRLDVWKKNYTNQLTDKCLLH